MGADSVWITPGTIGSRLWEEAAEDFCRLIEPTVARAKELGITFAVEPTNSLRLDISFIFTLRDSLELARAIGSGVVLELACCWYERGFEELLRKNMEMITLVQIADFKIGTLSSPDRVGHRRRGHPPRAPAGHHPRRRLRGHVRPGAHRPED